MTAIYFIFPILTLIGINLFLNCFWFSSTTNGGTIWGVQISASERLLARRKRGQITAVIGFVIISFSILKTFVVLLGCLIEGGAPGRLYVAAFIIALLISIILFVKKVKRVGEHVIGEIDYSALEQLPVIQRVNELIPGAKVIVVSGSDISLYDVRNYCFATEDYRSYKLGNLSNKETDLVYRYFAVKYKDEFTQFDTVNSDTAIPAGYYSLCRKSPAVNSAGQTINK